MSAKDAGHARRLREKVAAVDGYECAFCGVSGFDVDLTLDHKTPRGQGGSNDLANLQLLCLSCNSQKGTQTQKEAQQPVRFASKIARSGFTVAHNVILFDRNLSPAARLLYLQLRHFAYLCETHGAEIPDQDAIAANLGIKERAMRPYLAELVDAKLLRIQRRGRGLTNRYIILEPTAAPKQDRQSTADQGNQDRQPTAAQNGSLLPLHKSTKTEDFSEPNGSAQNLTQEFVDTATARGSPPTRRVIGQFAKNAKQLLDEGVAPERVRAGIGRMLDRGVVTPALLGNFVTEAGIQRAPPVRVTGWRLVRGSHGSSFVEDHDGTDIPPKGYA